MSEAYDGPQVVGMDLHRRRSVLVRMTADGRKLETARISNSPAELRRVIARAGKRPQVVLEATYGWYWAADTLAAAGAQVHLAHPLGVKAFAYRRVKNDPLTEHSDVSAGHRLGGSHPLRPLTCAGPDLLPGWYDDWVISSVNVFVSGCCTRWRRCHAVLSRRGVARKAWTRPYRL
jgi:hypothetical protein